MKRFVWDIKSPQEFHSQVTIPKVESTSAELKLNEMINHNLKVTTGIRNISNSAQQNIVSWWNI